MNTSSIDYNAPFIMGMHSVLMAHYGCNLCQIIGPKDTDAKFAAVFVLKQFYGYDDRNVGIAYSLPIPFVKTIVGRQAECYAADEGYRNRLHDMLNEIEGYENGKSDMVAFTG